MTASASTRAAGLAARRALRAARIRGVAFALIGLVCFYLASSALETAALFKFWIDKQGGSSADLKTTVGVLWIVAGVASGLVGLLQLVRGTDFPWRRWLLVLLVPFVSAIIAGLLDGKAANLTGVLDGTLELAAPITLGALAGILSERSGMFNIALEGKMLMGACVAAIVGSVVLNTTHDPLIGVLAGVGAAMLSGALLGLLLAWLGIRHKVDQIIAGTVINIGAVGITNFLFLRVLGRDTSLNTPPTIEPVRLPLLADVPVLGPILFTSKPYVYVAIILVVFLTYMIYRTRWGLRLRASGEKPAAAGTVGVNVLAIRYRALLYAGILAGLAGSYLSLSAAGSFQMDMSAGRGFIALAAMIFGAWHPIGAFGAALVFGFADTSQALLSILGVEVPPQLLNSVPYVITIVVVAGVVGRVRGPASAGQPYEQG
ncbi:MAG TPA: ABC transporter permease [Candidatus Sulfomarinibacteraceae bacterium]|nr:ABC transporter permease [Candidatus Sulfomarinibacteraceae bacterium]